MGQTIHCRNTPDGKRFRIWSSVVDKYITRDLTREEIAEHLFEDYRLEARMNIDSRLSRAANIGDSSVHVRENELDKPWHVDRCDECGCFHHSYKPRADGSCSDCGEPQKERSHGKPCAPRRQP